MDLNGLFKTFEHFSSDTDNYLGAMFINVYHHFPKVYRVFYKDDKLSYAESYMKNDDKEYGTTRIDLRKLVENFKKDESVMIFNYSAFEYLIVNKTDNPNYDFLMNITLGSEFEECFDTSIDIYVNNENEHIDELFGLLRDHFEIYNKEEKVSFGIAAIDSSDSLYTTYYDYDPKEINIKKNYNDDLPYDEICDILETEDEAELLLFYGEPGTGKSSLIKHFISKYPDKDFVFLDGSIIGGMPKEKLMSYFLENQDTIFILEDCERALLDREESGNAIMPVLLNLTDGIIGDVLNIKLICTFNTNLQKIDKALLRKGRLSLKYEFKKLSKEKTAALLNKEDAQPMTLADIYYINKENDFSKKKTTKIGFGV